MSKSSGRVIIGKNPMVAVLLSFFFGSLGLGQFYNTDWKKGLLMAIVTLSLGVPSDGYVPIAIWIWSMLDSYKVAGGRWKAW